MEVQVEATEEPGSVTTSVPLLGKAMPGPMNLDHLVTQAGGPCERPDFEVAFAGCSLGPAVDGGEGRVDPRLRFGGPRRRTTPEPGQFLAGQVAPAGLRGCGLRLTLEAGLEPRGVPTVVDVGGAPVQFEDLGGHSVEHMTIVGHQEETAPEAGEAGLEPTDGIDVEVVGRLVEHQQVDLLCQQVCEGDPLSLAAAQGRHGLLLPAAHAQPVEYGGHLPSPAHGFRD